MPISPPRTAIVIGGGVVGSACGLRLADAGVAVTLVDDAPAQVILVGDLEIDVTGHTVKRGGEVLSLTPLEFDLLCALAAEPGVVRSRDALMREVWGWADASGTRTLDSHVKALRAKIGAHRGRTAHGVGYALAATP